MPPDVAPSRAAYAAALATILLWASAFPAIAVGLRYVDPAALAATRFAVAGGVAACWLACRARGLPQRADLARVVACGMLGIALYNLLLNLGQRDFPRRCKLHRRHTDGVRGGPCLGASARARWSVHPQRDFARPRRNRDHLAGNAG
ncbi:EamA family transporter [Allosphingosinicella deserti]|uniref:EamA family transporter n=1 Tax=Allosphingosinicella deserti TaxID=2116704 RepID=UPI0038CD5502